MPNFLSDKYYSLENQIEQLQKRQAKLGAAYEQGSPDHKSFRNQEDEIDDQLGRLRAELKKESDLCLFGAHYPTNGDAPIIRENGVDRTAYAGEADGML